MSLPRHLRRYPHSLSLDARPVRTTELPAVDLDDRRAPWLITV